MRPRAWVASLLAVLALSVPSELPAQAKGGLAGAGVPLSEGVERLMADLRGRQADFEKRELEIAERERSIAALEKQLERRLAELEVLRVTVERRIDTWSAQDGDRVTRLAKVYAAMPPRKAGALLQALDLDLAAAVVARMKDKKSAEILSQLPHEDALRLSRRLVRPLAEPGGKQ
jgi:flagellar motility protein MotE (MotC chaperone)